MAHMRDSTNWAVNQATTNTFNLGENLAMNTLNLGAGKFLTACPVGCEGTLELTQTVLPEGPLLRCVSCGQWISQCSENQYWQSMEEFNDPRGTLPDQQSEARSFRRSKKYLDTLSQLLGKTASQISLLDVGCSSGAFLGAAVKLGYKAEGVEPAERAAATAQLAGLRVYQGLLHQAAFSDGQFDAVTLLEVIEHLKSPLGLLKECQRIIRPGGLLLIGTANANSWSAKAFGAHWDYLRIEKHGGHVSFFNPRSLDKLAKQAGFTVSALKTRSVRFCDRSNSTEPTYTLLKIAAEVINPLASLLDKGSDMAMYLRRI